MLLDPNIELSLVHWPGLNHAVESGAANKDFVLSQIQSWNNLTQYFSDEREAFLQKVDAVLSHKPAEGISLEFKKAAEELFYAHGHAIYWKKMGNHLHFAVSALSSAAATATIAYYAIEVLSDRPWLMIGAIGLGAGAFSLLRSSRSGESLIRRIALLPSDRFIAVNYDIIKDDLMEALNPAASSRGPLALNQRYPIWRIKSAVEAHVLQKCDMETAILKAMTQLTNPAKDFMFGQDDDLEVAAHICRGVDVFLPRFGHFKPAMQS